MALNIKSTGNPGRFRISGGGSKFKTSLSPGNPERPAPLTPGESSITTFDAYPAVPRTSRGEGYYGRYFTVTVPAGDTCTIYVGPDLVDTHLTVWEGAERYSQVSLPGVILIGSSDDDAGLDEWMTWNSSLTFTNSSLSSKVYLAEASVYDPFVDESSLTIRAVITTP